MVKYVGRLVCGLKLAELAKTLGRRNAAVVATNANATNADCKAKAGNRGS